jgi:hypothetical protein
MSTRRKGSGPAGGNQGARRQVIQRKAAAALRESLYAATEYMRFTSPATWELQAPHIREELARARLQAEALIAVTEDR